METSNRQIKGGSSDLQPECPVTLDCVQYDDIKPHPLSLKIYGEPKPSRELLGSIEKVGLLQPLIVNKSEDGEKQQLLCGVTRRAAWEYLYKKGRLKSRLMPCRFVNLPSLDAEQIIIESNRQRVKTPAQIKKEVHELLRIEKALADQRMRAGKTFHADKRPGTNPSPKSAKGRSGRATQVVAKQTGQSRHQVEKVNALSRRAENGDQRAIAILEDDTTGIKDIRLHRSPRNAALTVAIQVHEKTVSELNASIQQKGLDAEVSRSKTVGKFHLTIRNRSEQEIHEAMMAMNAWGCWLKQLEVQ